MLRSRAFVDAPPGNQRATTNVGQPPRLLAAPASSINARLEHTHARPHACSPTPHVRVAATTNYELQTTN